MAGVGDSANLVITITAINEASKALQDVQRDVNQAGVAAQKGFAGAAAGSEQFTTALAVSGRQARVIATTIVSEFAPALGQATSALGAVTMAAGRLGPVLGVGVAALVTTAVAFREWSRTMQEAAEFQSRLNVAVRGFDLDALRGQMRGLSQELERLKLQQGASLFDLLLGGAGGPAAGRPDFAKRLDELLPGLKKFGEGLSGIVGSWLGDTGAQIQKTQQQLGQTGTALESLLPIERHEKLLALYQEQNKLLQEQARFRADLARELGTEAEFLEAVHSEVIPRLERQLQLERELLTVRQLRTIEAARARGAPEAEITQLFEGLGLNLANLDEAQRGRFAQLGEQTRQGRLAMQLRRLPAGAEAVSIEGMTPEQAAQSRLAGEEGLKALRVERLQQALQALQIRQETVGLSREEQATLELQLVAAQRLLDLEQANGNVRKEALINLQATVREQVILQRELERTEPLAGFTAGIREVAETWNAAGDRMRDLTTQTAQAMSQSFSDQFFSVITGDFKKLPDIARRFGSDMLRAFTDELAKFAIGGLFQQLRGGLSPFLAGSAGAGAGLIALTPAQAQAFQAAGIPVGATSTGQLVANLGAGGGGVGGAGGLNLPTPPLSLVETLLPTGVQSFLATPIAGGSLAGILAAPAGSALATEAAALGIGAGGLGPAGLTFGQAAGAAGGVIGLGLTVFSALQGPPTAQNIATSAVSGAISGAMLGTMIYPGVGTVIGAIAGAVIGGGAAAFGKGGAKKGPTTREKSRAEGLAAASAFQSALRGVTTLEGLIPVLNAQYAPHPPRQWTIAATRSDGSNIRTGMFVAGSGPQFGFTLEDLFDPAVIDSMEVIAGEHGAEEQQPQLAQEIVQKIQELAAERAQVGVTAREFLGDGLFREATVPGTLAKRLRGGQLVVEAGTVAGMEEADRVSMLRELAKLDYDQSLGILWRDPDTGEAVSVTTFLG